MKPASFRNRSVRLVLFSVIGVFLLLVLLAIFIPLPVSPRQDFRVLYYADLGIAHGVPLYDQASQADLIARLAHVAPEQVRLLPFPYPPWYALATIFLALFPLETAARLWFLLNLAMLLLSAWLLTDGWKPAPRLASFLAALLFVPVLGGLIVGQFDFPVLLGACLLTFSLRRQNVPLTALGAALLTFKPHLGGPILLIALSHLFLNRSTFSRSALRALLLAGIFLFLTGFFTDSLWPLHYLASLSGYRSLPGVESCGLCASLPVALVRFVSGATSITPALPLGLVLFVLLFALLLFRRRDLFARPESTTSVAVLVTLLSSPYLLNYDFALLLVPLFYLYSVSRRYESLLVLLAYLLPLLLLGLLAREASLYLWLPAVLLLSLQLLRTSSIDSTRGEA